MRIHPIRFLPLSGPLFVLAGCAPARPGIGLLKPGIERPARSAVIFFVDGLDHGRFHEVLDRGLLPNIQEYFVRGGVRVDHAVASLPAITYPNSVSLLTGRFPGHHGVLGNRWFDRHTLTFRDYGSAATYRRVNDDFLCPTLFEILNDRFTVNVQAHTRRGVSYSMDNWAISGIDWFFGSYSNVDRRVGERIDRVAELANRVGRWPDVVLLYSPGVDEVGHRWGPDSPRYVQAVRTVDAQVGRVAAAIERAGLAESTYFVLVSDHGHLAVEASRTFDPLRWLRRRCHLRVHEGAVPGADYAARFAFLERFHAVVINGVYRRLAIHLRGSRGWGFPATNEDVRRVVAPSCRCASHGKEPGGSRALHELPAVGLVCTRAGPGRIRVASREGSAIIERRLNGGTPQYRMVATGQHESADPLRYLRSAEFVARAGASTSALSAWRGSREWLAATASTQYPDFVPQIVEMFDAPRAGDIVVFAADDWSFSGRDAGGHGSCLDRDLRIPIYIAGPDLPRGASIDHGRLVDVMPTVLELLGESDRLRELLPIDGVSLVAALRAADSGGPESPCGVGAGQAGPAQ